MGGIKKENQDYLIITYIISLLASNSWDKIINKDLKEGIILKLQIKKRAKK